MTAPDRIEYLGEVPEWLIGALSKSVVALSVTVGSNPTLSAQKDTVYGLCPFFLPGARLQLFLWTIPYSGQETAVLQCTLKFENSESRKT